MTEKDLRHMNRKELIEIIIMLKKKEISLEGELEEVKKQLSDKTIRLEKAGSIAEASLALSGVFDDAQKAADLYLASIKTANADIEKRIAASQEKCRQMLSETDRICEEKTAAAEAEIKRKKTAFLASVKKYLQDHPEIRLKSGESPYKK